MRAATGRMPESSAGEPVNHLAREGSCSAQHWPVALAGGSRRGCPIPTSPALGFPHISCQEPIAALIPAIILNPIMDVLTNKRSRLCSPNPTYLLIFPIPPLLILHPISTTVPPSGNHSSRFPITPLTCQLPPSRWARLCTHPTLQEVAQVVEIHEVERNPK